MKSHAQLKAVTVPLRRHHRSLYTSAVSFPPTSTSLPSSAPYFPYDVQPPSSSRPQSTLLPTSPTPSNSKAPSGSSTQTTHPSLALSPIVPFQLSSSPARSLNPSSLPSLFFYPPVTSPLFLAPAPAAPTEQVAAPKFRLESGAYGIPKRSPGSNNSGKGDRSLGLELDLAVQVGEDSYFLRPDALGVADGVGGWAHWPNANSALFSRKLMHYCSYELSLLSSPSSSSSTSPIDSPSLPPDVDPIEILQSSYDRCIAESRASGLLGSSTALLAILLDSELRIAHLGDCSIGLIRGNDMIFRSDEMQHSFNYPVQLGPRSQSTPRANAKRFDLQVQENDIVVLASDGMGDNLWDEDVLDEVMRFTKNGGMDAESETARRFQAQGLSEALASRAKRASENTADDPVEEVPFGRQAKAQGLRYIGGKPDDISVLVAVISGCGQPKSAA